MKWTIHLALLLLILINIIFSCSPKAEKMFKEIITQIFLLQVLPMKKMMKI